MAFIINMYSVLWEVRAEIVYGLVYFHYPVIFSRKTACRIIAKPLQATKSEM